MSVIEAAGHRAETRVLTALTLLPAPWQHFHTVEWRTLTRHGEVRIQPPGIDNIVKPVKSG